MEPDRRIVGLDIASQSTGWSLIEFKTPKAIAFDVKDFGILTAVGSNMTARMGVMSKKILDHILFLDPDRVFVEDPLFASIGNKTTTIKLAQLNYHSAQIMRMAGFEVINVPVRKARQVVLGKNPTRRTAKSEIMRHYTAVFPEIELRLPRKWDDVTDALCIADAGERMYRRNRD